ncbi:GDP-mannose-dependent alpha-mannosyltransferase [Enhygromyxa salina]|uniref:GDP-mannose-dependent alpha-mannosyltransferase n=1 Tax=Enhygromyxa salina TaxID=215803 RepID=A0A2S9XD89_9BACT|nr:glycosyltransferase [Enhygromyxa salina]PRP90838.1 GDP-mannose-dependent alpha-mannosyltransferase [Enhygromyxa salina]
MLTILEVSNAPRASARRPDPGPEAEAAPLRRVIVEPDRASWTEAHGRDRLIEHVEAPLLPGSTTERALIRARGLRELVQLHRPAAIVCGSPVLLPALVRLAGYRLEPRPARVGSWQGDGSEAYLRRELARVDPRVVEPGARALAWWTRQGLASFDAVFVGSRDAGRRLWARGIDRIYYVPRGVDLDRFTPDAERGAPDRPGRGSGRLRIWIEAPSGDVGHLGRVRAALCQRLPVDPKLVIRAPVRASLERFAAGHSGVELGAFEEPSERAGALAACDLAIVLGSSEHRRSACAEAMACGLPVIAEDGGAAELIRDGACGRALARLDPAGLGDAVVELVRAGQLRELGRRARQFIERFDLASCAAREAMCLREVVDAVRRGRAVPRGIHERTPPGFEAPAALSRAPGDAAQPGPSK